ncbi:polyamine-transporting ATPase 13A3-like isoform X2 [Hydra vulgaris]|uniref:Cation-transporting ATPase n=1 Tax=Hydra vulgaris TaxID=6087 RepID=A0ABM4BVV7_HYDVU
MELRNLSDQANICDEEYVKCQEVIVVHADTENEFTVLFYCRSLLFTIIFYLLGTCTAGIIFLIGYWYPIRRLKLTHNRCNIKEATSVKIKKKEGKDVFVSKINEIFLGDMLYDEKDFTEFEKTIVSKSSVRYFEFMFLRYIISEEDNEIIPLVNADKKWSFLDIRRCKHGTNINSVATKLVLYSDNFIKIPVKSFWMVFLQLSLDPFYVFQVISIVIWCLEDYTVYAIIIVITTLLSLTLNSYQTKQAMVKLRDMIPPPSDVQVLQRASLSTSFIKVIFKSTKELVPGDILVIPAKGMELPCDVVLLKGRCVVNESTLTGESIPSTKIAIDEALKSEWFYSVSLHKQHTMFNGTNIIQAQTDAGEEKVLALVIRTGFYTLKGELIRSIIYPKPVHFTFFRDSMKFLLWISAIALVGFIYSVVIFKQQGASNIELVKKAFDCFLIIIPAALPATMTVGLLNAARRLKDNDIFCVDPNRINVCGKVKLVVFDKTGTLTEDQLTVSGVIPVVSGNIMPLYKISNEIVHFPIYKAMSTCHNLSIIDEEYLGDPIDMFMFHFTGCKLYDSSLENVSLFEYISKKYKPHVKTLVTQQSSSNFFAVLKHFTFDSDLQRMSVITSDNQDDKLCVYAKGSPEKILSMCIQKSIPIDIKEELEKYTYVGHRVLAVAYKELTKCKEWNDVNKIPRDEIESNLFFAGIIVFENVIKLTTGETINILSQANIRTLMATGDDLLTASFIAREINMVLPDQDLFELSILDGKEVFRKIENPKKNTIVKERPANSTIEMRCSVEFDTQSPDTKLRYALALSGETFQTVHLELPLLLPKILVSGTVFARMSPNQKTMLVEDLQKIGYGVGMCGDGANDCGALRAAHAGIALSCAEASIAAPFTSKIFNISCVPTLIKEGRASLVTAFGSFKYMVLYSMVEFFGVIALYGVSSNFTNNQYVYTDIGLNLPLVFTMTLSGASSTLALKRPLGKLVHPIFIGGIVLQVLLIIGIQLTAFFLIKKMSWYVPINEFEAYEGIYYKCYENNVIIIVSYYLIIGLSFACLKGRPYRCPFYYNYVYGIVCSLSIATTLYITIYPERKILHIMDFVESPNAKQPIFLIGLALCHFSLSLLLEYFLETTIAKKIADCIRRKKVPKNRYKHIFKELHKSKEWPSHQQMTFS